MAPNYEASSDGFIRNKKTKKILRPEYGSHGRPYLQLCVMIDKKKKMRFVHQLVANAFLGKCPTGFEVDHVNFIADDNRIENLRYLEASLNHRRQQKNKRVGVAPLLGS